MKKFLIGALLLLTAGCDPPPPKFHYRERVRVNSGFYSGMAGEVDEHIKRLSENWYLVHMDGEDVPMIVPERALELEAKKENPWKE